MRFFTGRLRCPSLVFLPLALAMLVALCAATPMPRFGSYPADAAWNGRHAPLVLASSADRMYRTRLREGAAAHANFAGHYSLALWGCGMECIMGAAIDLHSGRVVWLPGTVCCYLSEHDYAPDDFEPVRFRADSRLIELTGLIDEQGKALTHAYVLQGGRFVHLADRALPAQSAPAGEP